MTPITTKTPMRNLNDLPADQAARLLFDRLLRHMWNQSPSVQLADSGCHEWLAQWRAEIRREKPFTAYYGSWGILSSSMGNAQSRGVPTWRIGTSLMMFFGFLGEVAQKEDCNLKIGITPALIVLDSLQTEFGEERLLRWKCRNGQSELKVNMYGRSRLRVRGSIEFSGEPHPFDVPQQYLAEYARTGQPFQELD